MILEKQLLIYCLQEGIRGADVLETINYLYDLKNEQDRTLLNPLPFQVFDLSKSILQVKKVPLMINHFWKGKNISLKNILIDYYSKAKVLNINNFGKNQYESFYNWSNGLKLEEEKKEFIKNNK